MNNPKAHTFLALAKAAQRMGELSDYNAKIELCACYFQQLNSENEVRLAAQYLGEGAFSKLSGKRVVMGSRTYSTLAAELCEIDYEAVFKPSKSALGDAPETIEKLWANIPEARAKWTAKNLSLEAISNIYDELENITARIDKQQILANSWIQMTPLEVKYFLRIMGRGSLSIGFDGTHIELAVAKAFNQNPTEIHYAHILTGSIGETAVLAKKDLLDEARFTLFHPIEYMPASPTHNDSILDYSQYLVEEKLDGLRCQLHISGEKLVLFDDNLNDITALFPEITAAFSQKELPNTVLDGQICIFKNQTILPSQLLQKRVSYKKPSPKQMQEHPAIFVAFDLLYAHGKPCFEHPLHHRRAMLVHLAKQLTFPVTTLRIAKHPEHTKILFERAIAHGNHGLLLKHKNSEYEFEKRNKSWLKLTKSNEYLTVVLMYAHTGNDIQRGYYSGFTLGVSVQDDERFEENFIPITKTNKGVTQNEMKQLHERIKEIIAEKYGPTLGLYPDIVVELEYEEIRVNKRTKADFTLSSPEIKTLRWELSPNTVDTLKEVEKRYQKKITQERQTQLQYPAFFVPKAGPI
jgi:DNA ligase-1